MQIGGVQSPRGAISFGQWQAQTMQQLEGLDTGGGLQVRGMWPMESARMYVCAVGRGDTMLGCCAQGCAADTAAFAEVEMDDVAPSPGTGAGERDDYTGLLRPAPEPCGFCGERAASGLDMSIWTTLAAEVQLWQPGADGALAAVEGVSRLEAAAATLLLPSPEVMRRFVECDIAYAGYASRGIAFDKIFSLYRAGPSAEDFAHAGPSDEDLVETAVAGTRAMFDRIDGDRFHVDAAGSTFEITVRKVPVVSRAEFDADLAASDERRRFGRRHEVVCVVEASESPQPDWRCFDLCYLVFDDFDGERGFVEHSRHSFGVGPDLCGGLDTSATYVFAEKYSNYQESIVAAEGKRIRSMGPLETAPGDVELGL